MTRSRRRFAMLVGLLTVGACGANQPTNGASTTEGTAARSSAPAPTGKGAVEVAAKVPRSAASADLASAVRSVNELGYSLLGTTLGTGNGNVALSPWSIATALTMARAGAEGQTAAEMDKVLAITDAVGIHASANALDLALASRNGTFKLNGGTMAVELATANRAFVQRDSSFEHPFLETLAADYGAGVGLVDYKAAAEEARASINRWVASQTKDRIPNLIDRGVLDAMTRLVLVNAVYLKADWQTPFVETATAPATFHAPSKDVTVAMMHGSEYRHFAAGDGWKAVELAYGDGKLAMVVVSPDAGRFDAVTGALPAVLAAVKTSDGGEVNLSLPTFDIASSVRLKERLAALGMPTAFSAAADFSAMSTTEPLQIADVVHQANLTVNEHGTVASAATAVIVRASSASSHIEQMVVDRPFLYAIVDQPTGAILFAGQVTDPSASS